MSNGENGKNSKEKEIDRLLKLIDSIARVDTKLTTLNEQSKDLTDRLARIEREGAQPIREQLEDIKKQLGICSEDIMDAEKRRNELITVVSNLVNKFNKLQTSFDRWKIYFGLIAAVGSPALTTFIIWVITKCLGNVF